MGKWSNIIIESRLKRGEERGGEVALVLGGLFGLEELILMIFDLGECVGFDAFFLLSCLFYISHTTHYIYILILLLQCGS